MCLPGREQQQQQKELLMSYLSPGSPGAPQAVQEGSGSGDGDARSLWGLLGVRLHEGELGEPKPCWHHLHASQNPGWNNPGRPLGLSLRPSTEPAARHLSRLVGFSCSLNTLQMF